MSQFWANLEEFGQSPTGVLYFIVLPLVLTLATSVIYMAERELKKHPSQIIELSLVAYVMAWLTLAVWQISEYFWSQLNPLALVLAALSLLIISPLITYMAVIIVFQCTPQAALRFWGRWIVIMGVLLLLLAFLSLGVGT